MVLSQLCRSPRACAAEAAEPEGGLRHRWGPRSKCKVGNQIVLNGGWAEIATTMIEIIFLKCVVSDLKFAFENIQQRFLPAPSAACCD